MVYRLSGFDHKRVAGASVLATLADERLWHAFQAIGIQAIHTSPMKRSGGVSGRAYTPSIDAILTASASISIPASAPKVSTRGWSRLRVPTEPLS